MNVPVGRFFSPQSVCQREFRANSTPSKLAYFPRFALSSEIREKCPKTEIFRRQDLVFTLFCILKCKEIDEI